MTDESTETTNAPTENEVAENQEAAETSALAAHVNPGDEPVAGAPAAPSDVEAARTAIPPPVPAQTLPADPGVTDALGERIDALEARVAALEARE